MSPLHVSRLSDVINACNFVHFATLVLLGKALLHSLSNNRFVKENIEKLLPLFDLDVLLPFAVLYFCPREEVSLLFDFVPTHLALWRIELKLRKTFMETGVSVLGQLDHNEVKHSCIPTVCIVNYASSSVLYALVGKQCTCHYVVTRLFTVAHSSNKL